MWKQPQNYWSKHEKVAIVPIRACWQLRALGHVGHGAGHPGAGTPAGAKPPPEGEGAFLFGGVCLSREALSSLRGGGRGHRGHRPGDWGGLGEERSAAVELDTGSPLEGSQPPSAPHTRPSPGQGWGLRTFPSPLAFFSRAAETRRPDSLRANISQDVFT